MRTMPSAMMFKRQKIFGTRNIITKDTHLQRNLIIITNRLQPGTTFTWTWIKFTVHYDNRKGLSKSQALKHLNQSIKIYELNNLKNIQKKVSATLFIMPEKHAELKT